MTSARSRPDPQRAGDSGQVAAPRHLDQNRARRRAWCRGPVRRPAAGIAASPAGQGQAGSAQGEAGQARGHRRGVPGQLGLVGSGPDLRRRLPLRLGAAGQRPGPPARDQLGELGRAGEPADQRGRTGLVRAQGENLAGVRVRRARLGVQVVAVVPEHDQAEIRDGGEHRGPGACHHLDQSPAHGQPAAVALGRAEVRAQADMEEAMLRHIGQGRVDAVQVTGVRHDDEHAAARGGRDRCGDGDLGRPFRAGQRRPGGPDRAGLRQAGQESRPGWVADPGAWLRPLRQGVALGFRTWGVPFRRGVPGRNGQPEHVGQRARVPVRHRPGQIEDLGREHRLRRSHPLQPGQFALMLARLGPFQQVAVDQLAGEPDSHPAARHGRLIHAGRDEVIEGAVEVSERDVHRDPGDGQPLAHRLILRPLDHSSVLPEPGRRLGQGGGHGPGQKSAASRSWSARSVRSHEKSGSVRPKCP